MDSSRRETDAEHSWHFALMAMTLLEYAGNKDLDTYKVLRMALVHDLIEIYAGDTFAYDPKGHSDKYERETAAADKLFSLLPEDQGKEFGLYGRNSTPWKLPRPNMRVNRSVSAFFA